MKSSQRKPKKAGSRGVQVKSPTPGALRRASDWPLSHRDLLNQGALSPRGVHKQKLTEGVQKHSGNRKTNPLENLWAQLPFSFHTHSPDLSPAEALFSPDQHVMPTQEARPLAPREKPYWDPQGSMPEGDSAPVTTVASPSRVTHTIKLALGFRGKLYQWIMAAQNLLGAPLGTHWKMMRHQEPGQLHDSHVKWAHCMSFGGLLGCLISSRDDLSAGDRAQKCQVKHSQVGVVFNFLSSGYLANLDSYYQQMETQRRWGTCPRTHSCNLDKPGGGTLGSIVPLPNTNLACLEWKDHTKQRKQTYTL